MEKFDDKNVQVTTEQQKNKSKATIIGEKMGEVMVLALCACVTAVVIALTTKLIFWLF